MHRSKALALALLRLEIENLRMRGFGGLLCISRRNDACGACPLLEFVPQEYRKESMPCVHIRLNERGETAETISREHDRAYLERQLLEWMEQTAQQLQEELAREHSRR